VDNTFVMIDLALGSAGVFSMIKKSKTKKLTIKDTKKSGTPTESKKRYFLDRIGLYYTIILFTVFFAFFFLAIYFQKEPEVTESAVDPSFWMLLERQSNTEYLFLGTPGEKDDSKIVKIFKVKSGIPRQRPTPLPQLMGREYWIITNKFTTDNPETAPYFIELDVPWSLEYPFGPVPYDECNGQCNWQLPGPFGLHGVAGDNARLSSENLGSSGCIRHTDEDIEYLYSILEPNDKIRYYIRDI
jgi:hypothetical protein